MGTALIVVIHPLAEDSAQVLLIQYDHEVEALAPHRSDEALAKRVGLRRSHRRKNKFSTANCARDVRPSRTIT